MAKAFDSVLNEHVTKQEETSRHDVFLSHSFGDKELIYGIALTLEDMGYTVYLDWRDDPKLDRKNVSAETAAVLRGRMKNSKCLFFATSDTSSSSSWMPWELGYKDGGNGRAAILPVTKTPQSSYSGQEYLGLYPYVSQENDTAGKSRLWINRSKNVYVNFDGWLSGEEPYPHK